MSENASESRDVAPVRQAPQAILPAWFAPGGGVDYWTSLDPSTEEGEIAIYQARQGEAETLGEHLNEPFNLVDILVHQATVLTEDGETRDLCRVVLITDDGRYLSTCSDGVRRSIMTLFGTKGLPPYKNGVRMKCRQVSVKGKNRLYLLDRVFDAPAKKGADKKSKSGE